jgi:hypothetical protein
MHKRLLGALLFLVLLVVIGGGRLIWRSLVALAALHPKTLLVLVGLAVALSLPNPVSDLLAQSGIWPLGHVILVRALPALGVGVLYQGLRAPGLSRLRRRLLRPSA